MRFPRWNDVVFVLFVFVSALFQSCATLVDIPTTSVPDVVLSEVKSVSVQLSGSPLASTSIVTLSDNPVLTQKVEAERSIGFLGSVTRLEFFSLKGALEAEIFGRKRFELETSALFQATKSDVVLGLVPLFVSVKDRLDEVTTQKGKPADRIWTRDVALTVSVTYFEGRSNTVLAIRTFSANRSANVAGLDRRSRLADAAELLAPALSEIAANISASIHPATSHWMTFLEKDESSPEVVAGLDEYARGDKTGAIRSFKRAWTESARTIGAVNASLVLFSIGERREALDLLSAAKTTRPEPRIVQTLARFEKIVSEEAMAATIGSSQR